MRALEPDILTTGQTARLLRCQPQTIEAAARRRELPGLKFGREWVFPRAALLEVLNRKALAALRPEPDAHAQDGNPTSKAVPPMPPARRGGRRLPPHWPLSEAEPAEPVVTSRPGRPRREPPKLPPLPGDLE